MNGSVEWVRPHGNSPSHGVPKVVIQVVVVFLTRVNGARVPPSLGNTQV